MKKILPLILIFMIFVISLTGCEAFNEIGNKINPSIPEYDVNFYIDGELLTTKSVKMGNTVSMPTAPERENLVFMGWYTDGLFSAMYDFSSKVIFDMDLHGYYAIDTVATTNMLTYDAMKSVVTIRNKPYNLSIFGANESQGSGVVIEISDGWCYVLTNAHVVDKPDEYKHQLLVVEDALGNSFDAAVYIHPQKKTPATDENYDLALICFKYNDSYLSAIPFGENPVKNQYVVSMGTPEGQKNAISFGKVISYSKVTIDNGESGKDDKQLDFEVIIHNSPILSGSSGGPLLDIEGKLVGVNFAGDEETQMGCAIPMDKVQEFLEKYVFN